MCKQCLITIQVWFTSAGWCKLWPVQSAQEDWSPPLPIMLESPLPLQSPPQLLTTLAEECSEDILLLLLGHAPSDCVLRPVDQLPSLNPSIGFLWNKYCLYQMYYTNIVHLVRGRCILQNWKKNSTSILCTVLVVCRKGTRTALHCTALQKNV